MGSERYIVSCSRVYSIVCKNNVESESEFFVVLAFTLNSFLRISLQLDHE